MSSVMVNAGVLEILLKDRIDVEKAACNFGNKFSFPETGNSTILNRNF